MYVNKGTIFFFLSSLLPLFPFSPCPSISSTSRPVYLLSVGRVVGTSGRRVSFVDDYLFQSPLDNSSILNFITLVCFVMSDGLAGSESDK